MERGHDAARPGDRVPAGHRGRRDASEVWSLMTDAIPTSIEALPAPAATAAIHRTVTSGASA